MTRRSLIIGSIIAIDVVALVVLLVLFIINVGKTAVMDVKLVPMNARLLIGSDEYYTGVYKMNPGVVTARIMAEGFEEKEIEIELTSDKYTRVYEYLIPVAENMNYYANNGDDIALLQEIGGAEVQEMMKKMSIKSVLPLINFEYGGLYGASREIVVDQDYDNCDDYICLFVTGASEAEKSKVNAMISEAGYNAEDYKIRYAY